MKPNTFPLVPKPLVEELERHFHVSALADTGKTVDELRVLQGEQRVVNFLRYQYEKQNKNLLE